MNGLTIYNENELKRIKELELRILKVVADICQRTGVEYFAVGGTALGAVRHHGFIPWDDDIDIGMTRENYRKFIREAQGRLPCGYHIQSPYHGRSCPYPYTKIRMDDTVFMEYCNRNVKMHQGVYIDIFPFDTMPDDRKTYKRLFRMFQFLTLLFVYRQTPDLTKKPENFRGGGKFILRRIIHYACRIIPYDLLVKAFDGVAEKYNDHETGRIACLCYPVCQKAYLSKKHLFPLADGQFEDLKIKIPGHYDAYLKKYYGNYMEYPPEEERFGHKPYKIRL